MTDTVITFVVNASWQTAAITAVALTIARFLRPQARFALLSFALIASLTAALISIAPQSTSAAYVVSVPAAKRIPIVVVLYLAGGLIATARLVVRVIRARRLLAGSGEHALGFRVADRIATPVTIGRSIVMPSTFADGDHTLVRAAIEHERAHAARRDYEVQLILEVIALPLYFHPAALLLRRAIAHARELACDERAAARCGRRAYANALVQIATLAVSPHRSLALSIAATSIERRVEALLRPRTRTMPASVAAMILAVTVFACSRSSVAASTLAGEWILDPRASDIHEVMPRAYDEFTQSIVHTQQRVDVRQRRVMGGRTNLVHWTVVTDGRPRPIAGERHVVAAASWNNGELHLSMRGPGRHRESAVASLRGDRLICEGQTERGRYHAEFVRTR